MLQLEVAGSLTLGSFTALPAPAQGSGLRAQGSGPRVYISPLCFSLLSDSPPCSSFPGGDDWASGGAICHVFAKLFAGDVHLQVCPTLLFPSAVRDGAPPNPNKTIVFGSESSYNVLPADLDFVCKNYRVYMCTPVSYAGSAPTFDDDMAKQRGRYDRQPHRAGRCKFL